jgi:hypothetical protein
VTAKTPTATAEPTAGQMPAAGPAATPAATRNPLLVDAAAVVLVLGYGAAVNRLIPHVAYVPANLAAAGIAIAVTRRMGVTWDGLGLGRDKLLSGLAWGSATVFPLAFGVAIAVALPATRGLFHDEAVTGLTLTQALYEVLVRIPFGTALAEEAILDRKSVV